MVTLCSVIGNNVRSFQDADSFKPFSMYDIMGKLIRATCII